MNPNNVNRFARAGLGVDRKRSLFDRSSKVLSTLDSGKLVPLYWDEVLPGDNFKVKADGVCRMATPIFPVLDNSSLDLYAFYVPNRLLWEHWENFMGQNDSEIDPWVDPTVYEVPQIKFKREDRFPTNNQYASVDVLSYLGVPPSRNDNAEVVEVNALPVRAYCKIWNEFFRDQNLQVPVKIDFGDSDVDYVIPVQRDDYTDDLLSSVIGGHLLPVNRYKDYYTTCLPSPQKGDPVVIPLGELAPVFAGEQYHDNQGSSYPMSYTTFDGNFPNATGWGTFGFYGNQAYQTNHAQLRINSSGASEPTPNETVYPDNLWANLEDATTVTINQLRLAFQTQRYLETLARGGSRYIEILYSLYGVKSSDSRLQRAEYLGGKRIPITMQQVAQTSATGTGDTPQGNISAFSLTGFSNNLCDHFFEEHGIFMILGCVRTDQTYAQGISRQWKRKTRFDYYAPVFAHLGEQPVMKSEIFSYNNTFDNQVFGYQEAWAEYRYKPNIATGYFNPNSSSPLMAWTYVNDFTNDVVLNGNFIRQPSELVGQTLALQDVTPGQQFLLDLFISNKSTRVMPIYSVPGLIDNVG